MQIASVRLIFPHNPIPIPISKANLKTQSQSQLPVWSERDSKSSDGCREKVSIWG